MTTKMKTQPDAQELIKKMQEVALLEQRGDIKNAYLLCSEVLSHIPSNPAVLHYMGLLNLKLNQPKEALDYLKKALKHSDKDAMIYNHAGIASCQLENLNEGITFYKKGIALNPNIGDLNFNLGIALTKTEHYPDAEIYFRKAISLNFFNPNLFYNFANVLHKQEKFEEAIIYYKKALEINPSHVEAAYNLSDIFVKLERLTEAMTPLEHILRSRPDCFETNSKLALVYYTNAKFKEAIPLLEKVLESPTALIYFMLVNCYRHVKEYEKEYKALQEGIELFPSDIDLRMEMVICQRNSCFWEKLLDSQKEFLKYYDTVDKLKNPFYVLSDYSIETDVKIAKKIANTYLALTKETRERIKFSFNKQRRDKIRIGYVSSDIRSHASSHLLRNMFSFHDRSKFEIFLYSTGPLDDSVYSKEIPKTVDHFKQLYEKGFEEAATTIYEDDIDILLDTTSYHANSPSNIFALRPAPIQINYLGYCAPTGAEFIDYTVLDHIVIEPHETNFLTEKVLYMPHTYFVNDANPEISPPDHRGAHNLPEDAFVFCCFNGHIKYDPVTFEHWMNILKAVPNSVLWLWVMSENQVAINNIYSEVKKYDVDQNRIIFAKDLKKHDHLARIQLADLFIDSFACSAHTTAIDALTVGLPVLTLYGKNIAQRGASSILNALELPELICRSSEEYEEKARYYANHPKDLAMLRKKVLSNQKSAPLFNTKLYVTNLEKGFSEIWRKYLNKEMPAHVDIRDL